MEIEGISSDICERLERGERLTKDQEKGLMKRIKKGHFEGIPYVVYKLRANHHDHQARSIEELFLGVNKMKWAQPIEANQHFGKMVKEEWGGAFTNMQANRLQNELDRRGAPSIGHAAHAGSQAGINMGMPKH